MATAVAAFETAPDPMVLALAFDTQELAMQALHAALKLQQEGNLEVHDAVLLGSDGDVVSSLDPTPVAAAVPSSLLGALVGTLVAGPLGLIVGGAVGGGTGVLLAKRADTGVPQRVMAQLRESITPGQYVLALLVRDITHGTTVDFAMRCGCVGKSTIWPPA